MAPLTRNRAGVGNVPHAMNVTYYQQRASAGLIIIEATQISPQGMGYPNTLILGILVNINLSLYLFSDT